MFFIGYLVTLICLSFAPMKQQPHKGLELVLQNEAFQELVFAADITGIEKALFRFALSQVSSSKEQLNPAVLNEGISRLAPRLSAIVFIDRLLKSPDPTSKAISARKIVEDGLFRKLQVRGAEAPKTTEISLNWARSNIQRRDAKELLEERQALLENAESDMRRNLLRAFD